MSEVIDQIDRLDAQRAKGIDNLFPFCCRVACRVIHADGLDDVDSFILNVAWNDAQSQRADGFRQEGAAFIEQVIVLRWHGENWLIPAIQPARNVTAVIHRLAALDCFGNFDVHRIGDVRFEIGHGDALDFFQVVLKHHDRLGQHVFHMA